MVLIVLTAVVLAAVFVGDIGATFVKKAESVPAIEPEQVAVAGTASPIRALMETADTMADISFREVVLAVSGHRVLPVDPASPEDRLLLDHLTTAFDALLLWINPPDSPTRACAG